MELAELASFVTAVSTIMLYMTGWPLVLRVFRRKSTGDLSTFPYIAMFVSCSVWMTYGTLVENLVIKYVNMVGLSHQIVFLSTFYTYSKSRKLLTRQIAIAVLSLVLLFVYIKTKMVHDDKDSTSIDPASILGQVGFCLSVIAYAAPLAAMGEVISSKSTASMNFPLSVANFIVGVEWTFYGKYLNDFFVMTPNLIGILVSIAQLVLFCVYPSKPADILPTSEQKTAQL